MIGASVDETREQLREGLHAPRRRNQARSGAEMEEVQVAADARFVLLVHRQAELADQTPSVGHRARHVHVEADGEGFVRDMQHLVAD